MRIDKFICDTINITRTQAKSKISKGCVYVDGERVKSCSFQVDEYNSRVEYEGVLLSYNKYVYIMMNKPAGVISATSDNKTKTALDLLHEKDRRHDLFIAGRLDKDTTGLLLITNDGNFAHDILSPKKHVNKLYEVTLEHHYESHYGQAFADGIEIDGGYICKPAEFTAISECKCLLKIFEGKFHQVKRMFEALDNKVVSLKRISMGELVLDKTLKEGDYRYLNDQEIENFVYKITKKNT